MTIQDPVLPAVAAPLAPSASSASSAMRGWLFRIGLVYWLMYSVELILDEVSVSVLAAPRDGLRWLTQRLDVWVGHHVLGIVGPINIQRNGSGDRTVDWIDVLVHVAIAVIVATLWHTRDRRRAHEAWLREIGQVTVRYALGFTMLSYGAIKLFALQFPAPDDGHLIQRWGDSSPMHVLWGFMGASTPYQVFTGAGEAIGGALVLFRRTKTLGALVLASVLINVVMLNLCYDVCVKLFSAHLLVMSVLVLWPDRARLLDLLVHRRAVAARRPSPVIARRGWRIARVVVKCGMIALSVGSTAWDTGKELIETYFQHSPWERHWSCGHWQVTGFVRDGQVVAEGDGVRWDRVGFEPYAGRMLVYWRIHAGEWSRVYDVTFDDAAHAMQLAVRKPDPSQPAPAPVTLHEVHDAGDPVHLVLRGDVDGHALEVTLERIVADKMLLRTRGFHWINEEPFNH